MSLFIKIIAAVILFGLLLKTGRASALCTAARCRAETHLVQKSDRQLLSYPHSARTDYFLPELQSRRS